MKQKQIKQRFKKHPQDSQSLDFYHLFDHLVTNKTNPERKKNDFKDIRERNRILMREKTR